VRAIASGYTARRGSVNAAGALLRPSKAVLSQTFVEIVLSYPPARGHIVARYTKIMQGFSSDLSLYIRTSTRASGRLRGAERRRTAMTKTIVVGVALAISGSLLGGCSAGMAGGTMLPASQSAAMHSMDTLGGGIPKQAGRTMNSNNDTLGGGPPGHGAGIILRHNDTLGGGIPKPAGRIMNSNNDTLGGGPPGHGARVIGRPDDTLGGGIPKPAHRKVNHNGDTMGGGLPGHGHSRVGRPDDTLGGGIPKPVLQQ